MEINKKFKGQFVASPPQKEIQIIGEVLKEWDDVLNRVFSNGLCELEIKITKPFSYPKPELKISGTIKKITNKDITVVLTDLSELE